MPQSSAETLDDSRWNSCMISLMREGGGGLVDALLTQANFEAATKCSMVVLTKDWLLELCGV